MKCEWSAIINSNIYKDLASFEGIETNNIQGELYLQIEERSPGGKLSLGRGKKPRGQTQPW